MYRPGDRVVYTASKHSRHPGPRAESLTPEPHGEGYFYDVKKFWRVLEVCDGGKLRVVTRRGKQREVPAADPRLRPARWWERILFGARFPEMPPGDNPSSSRPHESRFERSASSAR
ncbi:MAG: hypothetical protein MUF06_00410 [Pirellulaceae bacterium]|jgi:hypothetical protein|nr:hypothetical protein [Pirellulaceae bacterium]